MAQNTQVLIRKRIEIENQSNFDTHSFEMELQYIPLRRQVNISKALRNIQAAGVSLANTQIFYRDSQRKVYNYLGNFPSKQQIYLGYEYLIDQIVRLRYKKINKQMINEDKVKKNSRKVKERTIKEVCQSIKQWRRLYNLQDSSGRKIHTLESAAQIVGVAKKTLDDYYAYLRYAQYFGFDFQKHKNDKIGVLRRFVKHQKQNYRGMMERQLNIVDQFLASSSDSQDDTDHRF